MAALIRAPAPGPACHGVKGDVSVCTWNNLRQVGSYRADLLRTLTHIVGKVIDSHHAGRDGGGHLLHDMLDIQGGLSGLVCQTSDFACHHGKSQAVLAGFLRLDGSIERQQVGLRCHFRNRADHRVMFAARSLISPNLSAIRRVAFSSVCMVVSMWARLAWLFSAAVALLADMRATSCMVCTSSWDVAAMSCAAAPTWWVDVAWAVIMD